ncbi:MAG TPA: primosomal protein N' [Gemmatimonadales bacterium]|nr:primosomal protein N' [Gemmatimonadales bacterium]
MRPGARVVVPVRTRELVGIVVGMESGTGSDDPPAPIRIKSILAAPDAEPALPPGLLRTAEWMAGYYGAPIGLTLRAMLPSSLWGASRAILVSLGAGVRLGGLAGELLERVDRSGGEAPLDTLARAFKKPLWEAADRLVRIGAAELRLVSPDTRKNEAVEREVRLAGEPLTLLERADRFSRSPKRRRLYETIEQLGGSASVRHLVTELGFGDAVLRGLADSGLAEVVEVERMRDPFAGQAGTPPPETLTEAQRIAVDAMEALPAGGGALLFGVTGSGKTLVYLETIRRAMAAGRGAIILVPEIGLTPQAVSRVRGMFGDQVAVLHSALSDGERADAWRALRRGDKRVAVGARSAIFAPVADLGVVVVDEEHEASYKNGEAPRYHARDVARVRAQLEGARLILGSATPSLESFAQTTGRLALVRLPERIEARPLPPVELVDLRSAPLVPTGQAVPWSEALDAAMTATLARGEQTILLLNRRGYASFVQCPACGHVPECPDCSISLTLHRTPAGLRCHYCGRQEPAPSACPACGHAVQSARGIGTQQLEEMVAARFPGARLARMDLDTTSTKWSHHRILDRIDRGEVDVLLGTQMIAKGMDFPNVTLVGVVDADTSLHLPEFRAGERTYQLLAQVAGRAGRGPKGGRVLVQTRNPDHPALRFASAHDTDGFLAHEGCARTDPPYPPETALLNVLISAPEEMSATSEALRVADWLEQLIESHRLPLVLLGPAPCPLVRIKARWRWHVLLKGAVEEIGRVVRYAAPRLEGRGPARVVLDRDPASLL